MLHKFRDSSLYISIRERWLGSPFVGQNMYFYQFFPYHFILKQKKKIDTKTCEKEVKISTPSSDLKAGFNPCKNGVK